MEVDDPQYGYPHEVLALKDVTKSYGSHPQGELLHRTNIRLYLGDYVSVMGRSGSGKTTLLNLMGLLDTPTLGSVVIGGVEVGAMADPDRSRLRRDSLGFVFQAYNLIEDRNSLDNVALPLLYRGVPRHIRNATAQEALTRVGLESHVRSQVNRLSGGERQRVAIARALASRPNLLLCDEPTGNLDVTSAEIFLDLLDQLHGESMTLVVVTHDVEVASRASFGYEIIDGVLNRRF